MADDFNNNFVCRLRAPGAPTADELALEPSRRRFTDDLYRIRTLLEGLHSLTARPARALERAERELSAPPLPVPEEGGGGDA